MEKMEQYREKLKLQNAVIAVCCAVLAIFCFLAAASEFGPVSLLTPAVADSHWQSMWRGFISGASVGLLALMIVGLVRNILALHSDDALKKRYIKDHDERTIQIWTSARALSMQIFVLVALVAVIVAGYFNMTVSLTILACVLFHSLLGLGCKLYYSQKF